MSGTSYARILFFFLFSRSPLSPLPPALRFFSRFVSIDLRAFLFIFRVFFPFFFTEFRLSWDLFFVMPYVFFYGIRFAIVYDQGSWLHVAFIFPTT